MSPIAFVYFDLGNVLARFSVERACLNVAARWPVSPADVKRIIWTDKVQDRFEHGFEDNESFATIVRQGLGLSAQDCPTDELLDSLSDMFEPLVEMESVVHDVRTSGCRLGILSNTCNAHWRWLMQASYPSLGGRFDEIVLSYEEGVMKPHARIYELAQLKAGVLPEQILFFDDREENVLAAKEAGWDAQLFVDAAGARRVLESRGIIAAN